MLIINIYIINMKHFIGIDFGTSNTSISYIDKKGNIQLLKYNNTGLM